MKVQLVVTVNATMSLDESLELERALSGTTSPAAQALAEALRVQNSTASRLRATGAAA